MVYEIQAFLCFAIFEKNAKIQNGRNIWLDKIFLKIRMGTLYRYPVGQNFVEIALSCTVFLYINIFVFCNFCEEFQNSKWLPFLARQILKIGMAALKRYPVRQKFC